MSRRNSLKLTREELISELNENIGNLNKLWKKLKVSKVTGHNYINRFGIKLERKYV